VPSARPATSSDAQTEAKVAWSGNAGDHAATLAAHAVFANPAVVKRPPLRKSAVPAGAARRDSMLPALVGAIADGSARSGNDLAKTLGVTRAAVWKQIQGLRERGLVIAALPAQGYRLDAPVDLLDAGRILGGMAPLARSRIAGIDVHWQLDSTSSELLRRAGSDARDGIVCLSEIQTQGRGRRGRSWHMPVTGGIAMSLLKRFEGGMSSLAGLSLVVGIAVAHALDDCGIPDVGLKWPNDLVVNGAKLAGILVELGGDALGPCHAVIGIGINHRLGANGGAPIDQPWTDLAILACGAPPPRNRVVARVLERLIATLDRFAVLGFAAFAAEYARRDTLRGRRVSVLRPDGRHEGVVRDIDVRGALLVAFDDGERSIDSGEVSIRGIA
jgi:BirA family biotin operon repressor/biotin-[acetyl-CoA-carboxylase] ligase